MRSTPVRSPRPMSTSLSHGSWRRCCASPYVYDQSPPMSVVGSGPHRSLAREAAAASTVLLRNRLADGSALLPVDHVDRCVGWPCWAGSPRCATSVTAARAMSARRRSSRCSTGCVPRSTKSFTTTHDASIVEGADLVVVVVGYTKDDEGEFIDNDGTAALISDLFPAMDHPELGSQVVYEAPPGHQPGTSGECRRRWWADGPRWRPLLAATVEHRRSVDRRGGCPTRPGRGRGAVRLGGDDAMGRQRRCDAGDLVLGRRGRCSARGRVARQRRTSRPTPVRNPRGRRSPAVLRS